MPSPSDRPHRSQLTARRLFSALFSLFSAAMLGLAAGAMWMLATMFLQRPTPWLALPVAWLLGWAVRGWVRPAGRQAAVLAVTATALASIYVSLLIAGIRVAGSLGLTLVGALRKAGPSMLLELAGMALTITDLCWFVAALLLAAWTAGRSGTRHDALRRRVS